jgi:hypothetical protein
VDTSWNHSPWRVVGSLLPWFVACSLLMSAGGCSSESHSPSYRYGYDMMMTNSRQTIAEVNDQLSREGRPRSDSPKKLFGSDGHGIGSVCEANLDMATVGSTNGNQPKLPDPFSRSDFLSGCSDAGKALLSESRSASSPSATTPGGASQATPAPATVAPTTWSDVRVYNASTQRGLGVATADKLKAGGFNVTEVANLSLPDLTATTVYFGNISGERDTANAVGQLLGAPIAARIPEVADQPPGVIVVVTAER